MPVLDKMDSEIPTLTKDMIHSLGLDLVVHPLSNVEQFSHILDRQERATRGPQDQEKVPQLTLAKTLQEIQF